MTRTRRNILQSYGPFLEVLEGRCLLSTVTNLNDAGPGSLRDAIATTPSGGTVDFQAGLTGTIILMTNELAITKDVTIAGPGADAITVSGNHAWRVFYIGPASTVDISGITIANGWDDFDGGAGILSGDGFIGSIVTVTNCTLSGNSTGLSGGAILNNQDSTLSVTNCTFIGNSAEGDGGGIDNFGTVTVTNSTLSDNSSAVLQGGGINNLAWLSVTNSTLCGNSAGVAGGGIFNAGGTLIVTNSTLCGNSAEGGGAIANVLGTATVTSSTLSGNSAAFAKESAGGGIYNFLGTLTLINSTLSGNSADTTGGGIYNLGWLTVTSSTLSGNSAGDGGGIYNEDGPLSTRNTIIAGNTAPTAPDVSGNIDSLGHNLIGNTEGGSGFDDTDLLNVDPMLGPLQDNGGPTFTMALMPGSPAIDAGDNTDAPDWDQRGPGFPRIVNGIIDIGAFEVQDGGGSPGRSVLVHTKAVRPDVAALLPLTMSPSPVLFPSPSSLNSQPRGTVAGPQVAVVDRLFALLRQADAGFALAQMKVGTPIGLGAQEQIAKFLASGGTAIIQLDSARWFETPIQGLLPEGWNSIP